MSGTTDKAKGRTKEAIGSLIGDDKLKKEGRLDQRTGGAKEKTDAAIDAVHDTLAKASEALHPSREEK